MVLAFNKNGHEFANSKPLRQHCNVMNIEVAEMHKCGIRMLSLHDMIMINLGKGAKVLKGWLSKCTPDVRQKKHL
jgi:hypothetical protein